ncbi:MAG: XTP/dITP diphosphatase [Sedimentisphaerales bacterium]|nr:XTP/dITP diphosphatase [Sedimentisphaerales bacterium]
MPINNNDILIATTNPGKVSEIQSCLGKEFTLHNLKEFASIQEIEEDGKTFEENARKKAIGYSKATGHLTLADDSGLVIDALNGAPGVKSARFSGDKLPNEERTLIDHRNIKKVLELLIDVPAEKRTARFVCCMCLAKSDEILIETRGTLEGIIIEEEIGTNGFGYDPIFFVPSLNKTVAQLNQDEKNIISHRGNALKNLKEQMKNIF